MKGNKRASTPDGNVPILIPSRVGTADKIVYLDFGTQGIWKPFEGIFLVKIDADIATKLSEYSTSTTLFFKNVYTSNPQVVYKDLTTMATIDDFISGGRFLLSYDTDERKLYLVQ